MLGFEALRDRTGADSSAYRRPLARLAEGAALAPLVTAMMDVSDGLLLDAWRLAEASEVSLAIDSPAVPIAAPEARRLDAMRWGDDCELLFALPAGAEPPVPATRIGAIIRTGSPRAVTADTALRLARYFGTTPEFWLNLQTAYDLSQAAAERGQEIARDVHPRAA